MALILALNPGNSHSPTLSRLARELQGCELIGAESCVVAINAIKKRVPDVVLLPARQARGEADLIAHLKSIPGGVLTLKLPPVESADPVDLARQIREMLTGVSRRPLTLGVPGFGCGEARACDACGHVAAPARGGSRSHHLDSHAPRTMGRRAARRFRSRACRRNGPALSRPNPTNLTNRYEPIEPYEPYEPIEPDESDAHRRSRRRPDDLATRRARPTHPA